MYINSRYFYRPKYDFFNEKTQNYNDYYCRIYYIYATFQKYAINMFSLKYAKQCKKKNFTIRYTHYKTSTSTIKIILVDL